MSAETVEPDLLPPRCSSPVACSFASSSILICRNECGWRRHVCSNCVEHVAVTELDPHRRDCHYATARTEARWLRAGDRIVGGPLDGLVLDSVRISGLRVSLLFSDGSRRVQPQGEPYTVKRRIA